MDRVQLAFIRSQCLVAKDIPDHILRADVQNTRHWQSQCEQLLDALDEAEAVGGRLSETMKRRDYWRKKASEYQEDYGAAIELLSERTTDRDRLQARCAAFLKALKTTGNPCITCKHQECDADCLPCNVCGFCVDVGDDNYEFDEARFGEVNANDSGPKGAG